MRKNFFLVTLGMALAFLTASCSPKEQAAPAPPVNAKPDFKPVVTIKDIMDGLVDPSADELWESVSTTIDAKGVTERYPRTDEEWKKVRANAITLVEAPNLLMMARTVAKSGDKSQNPGIELQPEEIQALVDGDRATFAKLALDLQATAIEALKAIDEKDKDKLIDAGGPIDHACESCHLKYWYPNEAKGREAQEQGKTSLQGQDTEKKQDKEKEKK